MQRESMHVLRLQPSFIITSMARPAPSSVQYQVSPHAIDPNINRQGSSVRMMPFTAASMRYSMSPYSFSTGM